MLALFFTVLTAAAHTHCLDSYNFELATIDTLIVGGVGAKK
jgi:hypothetical protein